MNSKSIPIGQRTSLLFKLIKTSGVVNKDVDKTIPPWGVALPVKFVFPAEIVNNILHI